MTGVINVVMGGPSAEHEVSLNSGLEVLENIDKSKHRLRAVVITQDKQFYFHDINARLPELKDLIRPGASGRFQGPYTADAAHKVWEGCSVAFLALHGSFGEDGVFQGYLDTLGIPYTGSGVFASALAMNKIASKLIYEQKGISVPPYSIYGKDYPGITANSIAEKHGFPCFIKCPQSGSSRLMGRAGNHEELQSLISELSEQSDELLVETAIDGIEFSCAVIERSDGSIEALPPIEIRPKSQFFDYTAKYTDGASEEIVPAPRSEEIIESIKRNSLAAHKALGCKGISRTDMILKDGIMYVLETNTLPGMTRNSLLPKAFYASGGTYAELLDELIDSALARRSTITA